MTKGEDKSNQRPKTKNLEANNARGSLEETKYHLLLAKDLEYIQQEDFKKLANDCNDVGKMLNGLINSLEDKQDA